MTFGGRRGSNGLTLGCWNGGGEGGCQNLRWREAVEASATPAEEGDEVSLPGAWRWGAPDWCTSTWQDTNRSPKDWSEARLLWHGTLLPQAEKVCDVKHRLLTN
ncbi:hypothetical protein GOODEAATRI_030748, partial [Goodea atripinnis]